VIAQLFAKRCNIVIEPAALSSFSRTTEWLCTTPNTRPGEPADKLIDLAGNGRFVRTVIEGSTRKAKARMASDPSVDLLTADESKIRTITRADIDGAMSDVLAALDLAAP
jgi:hypothetical protein